MCKTIAHARHTFARKNKPQKNMNTKTRKVFAFEHNGQLFPYILLATNDFLIRIATISLENELLDANSVPKNCEATQIDNLFAFYVDNDYELQLPDDVLINLIYGST